LKWAHSCTEESSDEEEEVKGKPTGPTAKAPAAPPPAVKKPVVTKKWEGEDEEEDAPAVSIRRSSLSSS